MRRKLLCWNAVKVLLAVGVFLGFAVYAGNRKEKMDHLDVDNEYIKSKPIEAAIPGENIYTAVVKKALDVILAGMGFVVLAPFYAVISIAVFIDDPGPVIFSQKRVGKGCSFFYCHKFRTMKISSPHDVPTHKLSNPELYITRVGRFLRHTSLDELPQVWDILRGKMSFIGPRPALWNQGDLIAERAKYGANDVMPGMTGWAQINGRDELEIVDKAKLDGEYVAVSKYGGLVAAAMDIRCFFGTVKSVLHADGIMEGGTGSLNKG